MTIFKAYDIRGIYPNEISEKEVYKIGYYFAKTYKLKEIKIAHDKRQSYESLSKFLIQGILDANTKVIYLGLSSTPNFYYSLFEGSNTGIVITASHNPKEYNGLKFILNGDSFDSRNGLYDLEKITEKDEDNIENKFNNLNISNLLIIQFLQKNNITEVSTLKKYSNYLLEKYNEILTKEEKNIISKIKFSLDFSSGVSSLGISDFLKQTSLRYNLLNNIVDGDFPIHSPDPQKAQEFISNQENLGYFTVVFDGDGDRLMLYDENNNIVLQDYTIELFIDYFSKISKKFVCDLRISKSISDMAKENNLDIALIRVGRAFYQDYMKKNNCEFGAELSGHLFFKKFNYLDNPDIALIFLLKIIAEILIKNPKIKISDIFQKYKKYYKLEEKKYIVKNTNKLFEQIKNKYKKVSSEIDGISFDLDNFWFNIRKSNTEPVVKINLEAKSKEIAEKELHILEELINN